MCLEPVTRHNHEAKGLPNHWANDTTVDVVVPCVNYGAFTLDVKLVLNENLGGILGGRHPMLNGQHLNIK